MEKDGLLLIAQADHLTGEEIGWALQVLSIPGVRNRNLIPTLTKKGRMGYILLVDVDANAEPEVARVLLESFAIYGYHRLQTRHVHRQVVIREMSIEIHCEEKSIKDKVRMKGLAEQNSGPYFVESDDLFSLQGRIQEELGITVPPKDLRRQIEAQVENHLIDAASLAF